MSELWEGPVVEEEVEGALKNAGSTIGYYRENILE